MDKPERKVFFKGRPKKSILRVVMNYQDFNPDEFPTYMEIPLKANIEYLFAVEDKDGEGTSILIPKYKNDVALVVNYDGAENVTSCYVKKSETLLPTSFIFSQLKDVKDKDVLSRVFEEVNSFMGEKEKEWKAEGREYVINDVVDEINNSKIIERVLEEIDAEKSSREC